MLINLSAERLLLAANGPCAADGQSAISGGLLASQTRHFQCASQWSISGMQMQQGSWLILSVAFVLGTMAVGPASSASRLSPSTHMQCMESVLHKLPSISQVKSGVLSIDGQ